LMILPEIGGRIHIGQDVSNGYHFFYRQRVIKPALVGLFGPWISGGVEFNTPQHHRPLILMPVDWTIEREDDGCQTDWLAEQEPRAGPASAGTATSRCRPRTWRWAHATTSSVVTTMWPAPAWFTLPTTAWRRARSSGPGGTTSSATPGTAISPMMTARTWN